MRATSNVAHRLRCRLIGDDDLPAVVALLTRGFPKRTPQYWSRALARLARRDDPVPYPRYGYLLENQGALVGVILLIFTTQRETGETCARCNICCWYVNPSYRCYASLLATAAVRHKDVTYINIWPAVHTWPVIEAQGFKRYCDGQILSVPALSRRVDDARVHIFDPHRDYGPALLESERNILATHVEYGCVALVVTQSDDVHPFVFLSRRIIGGVIFPTLQLVYCRNAQDFVRFAGPIGRFLLKRGALTVLLDANGSMPGLVGIYFANRAPKYFKGQQQPRIGDLAYSETVLFGP